jgi:hypothetical protein
MAALSRRLVRFSLSLYLEPLLAARVLKNRWQCTPVLHGTALMSFFLRATFPVATFVR